MHCFGILALPVVLVAVSCPVAPVKAELTREQAIEIARKEASFEPDSIEAEAATSGGRPLWRVTMRGRLPGQPPGLFETVTVEIDRATGDVVSIARP